VCVDWVEITYNSLRTRERFCGSGEVNEVHVDGLNEITLEFSTNRQTEDRGFLYYIQCVDPGFDYNAVNSGLIPSLQAHLDPDVSCQPLQTQTMLTTRQLKYEKLLVFAQTFVVKMSWTIFYQHDVIEIRDEAQNIEKTIRGIVRIDVANRFSTTTKRYYSNPSGYTFHGYGFLKRYGCKGYYYQTGADPIFQPTPQEVEAILKIETSINKFLDDDIYDVEDTIDEEEEKSATESTTSPSWLYRPTIRPTTFPLHNTDKHVSRLNPSIDDDTTIDELASKYGKACNAILRATACTYQALILQKDCRTGLSLV
jgi:hypothetical protein